MLDLRIPALPDELGERLTRQDYKRDFRERRTAIRDGESWKLERLQHFEETNDDSRDALRRGDWPQVLRLFEAERDALRRKAREEEARGAVFHRIRVVEEPLTPYVQWELHWLRLSAECGHSVRVLPASAIASAEADGSLPELNLLDGRTLFRVLYTDTRAAGRSDPLHRSPDRSALDGLSAVRVRGRRGCPGVLRPSGGPPASSTTGLIGSDRIRSGYSDRHAKRRQRRQQGPASRGLAERSLRVLP
ncbi:DUF6879 family protein [Streptomyces bluensis]|uniref:DUF6879 family protein n=1 Tax=Streptomyces bluensis TaxID=33897 RepID=UPI0019975D95|nr:DUF6879 family protein [Streptomyces bluensis]GGZ74834.1 hypothetical protein GCM10010344_47380 [Streptomyces bluensis]